MGLNVDESYPIGGTQPVDRIHLTAGETEIRLSHPETGDEFKVVVNGAELRCDRIDDAH